MRSLFLVTLTVLAAAPPGAMSAQDKPALAVLPFEDGGSYGQDKENFAALQRGIPAILISELGANPAIRVVDRTETQRLLDEENLADEGRVDAATAAKIGKRVGARYMIFGTFVDLYGRMRVDARIVNVETGEILKVATSSRDRKELFRILRDVSGQIMENVNLPPLPADVSQVRAARNIPTEALIAYSRALLYLDRGDTTRAVELYRRALTAFPDFAEAKAGLQQTGG